MTIQKYFLDLLKENGANTDVLSPKLTKKVAQKLIERIRLIKLYAHSYAFALNFEYGGFDVVDLLNFAYEEGLDGIDMHIDYGKDQSLRQKSQKELKKIKVHAKKLGLGINLEISSTCKEEVDCAVKIAKILSAKNIRVYIRYGGHVSEIIKKGIQDLEHISKVAEKNDLQFVLEPHEVLKSQEVVEIIKKVNSPRLGLLFDFGNMITANENPLDALRIMSPYIHQVHMKGVKKIRIKGGDEQIGVPQGEGDLPQIRMLFNLLLLGESESQVKFYGLEQEVGYHSPPFRFDDEDKDPLIPDRGPSNTSLDKKRHIKEELLLEKQNACKQIQYVRNLLEQLRTLSELML